MTTPDERMRHLVQVGAFLVEIAVNRRCPQAIRRQAAQLAQHYPTVSDLALIGRESSQLCVDVEPDWLDDYPRGPLTAALARHLARFI